MKTAHGRFFVDPASNFGNAIVTKREYEPGMSNVLTSLLKEGDVFLDVGANEGYFSIAASKLVGESGIVISIEPQSRLQPVIFRNIDENDAFNIHVFQLAICDSRGMATISLLPDMNTGASGLFRTTRYAVPTEIVPQATLHQLFDVLSIDRVKLMKIDIEGFEYEAILGSKDIFAGNLIENIALELHPSILAKRGKPEKEIIEFLRESGYKQDSRFQPLIMSKR